MKNSVFAAALIVMSIVITGCGCPGKCPPDAQADAMIYRCDEVSGVCMIAAEGEVY